MKNLTDDMYPAVIVWQKGLSEEKVIGLIDGDCDKGGLDEYVESETFARQRNYIWKAMEYAVNVLYEKLDDIQVVVCVPKNRKSGEFPCGCCAQAANNYRIVVQLDFLEHIPKDSSEQNEIRKVLFHEIGHVLIYKYHIAVDALVEVFGKENVNALRDIYAHVLDGYEEEKKNEELVCNILMTLMVSKNNKKQEIFRKIKEVAHALWA